jgi:hypothetical protein
MSGPMRERNRGDRRQDTPGWEYEFKGKPGDPRRRPPQVAPYHLRLDWLMCSPRCRPDTPSRGWHRCSTGC